MNLPKTRHDGPYNAKSVAGALSFRSLWSVYGMRSNRGASRPPTSLLMMGPARILVEMVGEDASRGWNIQFSCS